MAWVYLSMQISSSNVSHHFPRAEQLLLALWQIGDILYVSIEIH